MTTENPETKIVLDKQGNEITVPRSTVIADRSVNFGWKYKLGEDCTIGENAWIEGEFGNRIDVGSKTSFGPDCAIGDDTTIGDKTALGDRCTVGKGVTIGNGCTIERGVRIQDGVVIPDNWYIPSDAIINPGPDGAPVVIIPQQSFQCNVRGTLRTGSYS